MSLFHAGLIPALDANGNPINGATWTFYLTGGLTPTNIYSNAACSVSIGSVITSGSNGRFSPCFVKDSTVTRGILRDASGTILVDVDPVSASTGGSVVSSVDVSGGTTGLTTSGGPVTTSGTITLGGTLAVANGGTGGTTPTAARSGLSAAASGANTDITSLRDSTTVSSGGTIASNSIGYRGLPQTGKTASYTLALTDQSTEIYLTGSTAAQSITIPANASVAFPIGSFVVITNDSTQSWTIPITTDTLLWSPAGSTGTRTLAPSGTCTLTKKTSTRWWISGSGLT